MRLLVLLLMLLLATACASTAQEGSLPDGDVVRAKQLVFDGAVLLDVRSPDEYASRHLPNATNVPVDDLQSRLGDVRELTASDQAKPIVVYCRSGRRAARAKIILMDAGYVNVLNVGGIDDWPTSH